MSYLLKVEVTAITSKAGKTRRFFVRGTSDNDTVGRDKVFVKVTSK